MRINLYMNINQREKITHRRSKSSLKILHEVELFSHLVLGAGLHMSRCKRYFHDYSTRFISKTDPSPLLES